MSTPKMQLIIEPRARFEWLEPPKNRAEEIMREQADVLAASAMHRIEPAIRVLVMELLHNDMPPNASSAP